jgi:nicotinate-nucleotide adenylyltransferase
VATVSLGEAVAAARLGIMGGTFDPIHHGHLVAAQEACFQLDLAQVIFVPVGIPPHKPRRPISAAQHRLRMIELAIAGRPCFDVSTVDLDRPGPCYTVDTLELLRLERDPNAKFFFVEGADSLLDMPSWYRPQRLLELCELAVVGRHGSEIDLARLDSQLPGLSDRVHWVDMPRLDISSSDLRARVRECRPIAYLVPAEVEAYIREQKLYP